jgi:hypothetical protein
MKELIFFALILAGSAAIPADLAAQTPGVPAAPPAAPAAVSTNTNGLGARIQFNTESYDFGKILAGDAVKYVFVATNAGDDTLEISNAKGSCSCTVVGEGSARNAWTLQKVAPGQTCRIPIEIATANYRGQKIEKFVTVTSNDKTRPTVNLKISGNVWLPIEVSPAMAAFNLTPGASNTTTQVLKIYNRTDAPLTVSDPASTTNAFSAVLKTNVPGQEFELTVMAASLSNLPPNFGTTVIQGTISLKTSATNMNPLQISAFETIYPEVTIYPPAIQIPDGPLAQASTNHITIRGNSAEMRLSDPAANVAGVDIAIHIIQTNRQYYLAVVFPKGFEIQPGQDVVLSVKTDNPRYPVLSVPVTPMRGVIVNRPPPVPPPARTSVLPPSILAGASTNAARAPAPPPNPPMPVNPPHP